MIEKIESYLELAGYKVEKDDAEAVVESVVAKKTAEVIEK